METLNDIYLKHKKGDWPDKGSVHSYIDVYEEILSRYRFADHPIVFIEIGLMSGESLRMWTEYFRGANNETYRGRTVFGMDCDIKPINGMADLTEAIKELPIAIGDATNPEIVKHHWGGIKFDIIIEDAGHDIRQQMQLFSIWKNYLKQGGIYVIEDVQDIDKDRCFFEAIGGEIIDRRHIKNRYDDVLVIIRK